MKRKISETPTRVYKYGLPLGPSPDCRDAVIEQMRLGHRYRNDLVRIEVDRRAAFRAATAALPDVAPIEARLVEIDAEIKALATQIKDAKATARSNVRVHPELRARIKSLKAERGALKAERKEARAAYRGSAELQAVDDLASAATKAARANSGAAWGTQQLGDLAIEQARKEPTDPRFRAWRGDGAIGVQIIRPTATAVHSHAAGVEVGLHVGDVLACTDTRLRIDVTPRTRTTRRHPEGVEVPNSATLWIRIGSNGRDPAWATFPMVLHRPLPADGVVKRARVQCRKIGNRSRWELCVTVEARLPARVSGQPGSIVAVDFGARGGGGDRRVALACGSDGRKHHLSVPTITRRAKARGDDGKMRETGSPISRELVDVLDHADSLRAIADREFNAARDAVREWAKSTDVPEWMGEALRYSHAWHNPRHLARLVNQWRRERIDGDDAAFAAAEDWRRQNAHLYQWESDERKRATAHRDECYRVWAQKLAREYDRVVVENVNFATLARRAAPEDDATHYANRTRNVAAPGKLRECVVEAFGDAVSKLETAGRRGRCPVCGGSASEADGRTSCAECGSVVEADFARCWNLLRDVGADTSALEASWREGAEMAASLRRQERMAK